jgi:hypothetical protein
MSAKAPQKVVRSYRVVFRRRWRIYRIERWRLPLPGGLELRTIGYWVTCLLLMLVMSRLPVLSAAMGMLPASLRLGAIPLICAWALSSWEVDGRPPHRVLAGLVSWWLRPRVIAGLRACPAAETAVVPLRRLVMAPDLYGPRYPRGRVVGPARMLLRYPVRVSVEGVPWWSRSPGAARFSGKRWRVSDMAGPPLHRGKTVNVPAGRVVIFEGAEGRG